MPVDATIALGLKPVQVKSQNEYMNELYTLRNAEQTNQMNQMKMNEANRLQGVNARFRSDLANLGDPNDSGYENNLRQAYINKDDIPGLQAHITADLANQKARGEIQKQKEELGAQTSRDLSRSSTDANVTAWFEDAMNSHLFSPQEKVKITNEYGRVMAIPVGEERAAYLRSKGQSAAEAKPSIIQQTTGNNANIVSIPASGGAPTTISSTPMGLTPEQESKMPSGQAKLQKEYTEAEAGIKALLAKANSAKTEPERAQALADAKALSASNSLRGEEITRLQQSTQPLEAKDRRIKDYAQAIRDGRSPNDQDMKDLRLQIEHDRSFAPPTRINVNSFDTASNAAQKDFILESAKQRTALRNSKGAIDNINKAIALIPSSAQFMGPGGEPLLNAASFLNNRIGLSIDTKGVTDATELRSRMFSNVIDTLKKLDSQPSERQQATLEKALGTIGEDPNALVNVLRAFQDVIRGKVEDYNADVTEAEKRGVKFPYKPQIDIGEYGGRTPPTSAAVAYLKANPATRALYDDKYGPGASDKILQGK